MEQTRHCIKSGVWTQSFVMVCYQNIKPTIVRMCYTFPSVFFKHILICLIYKLQIVSIRILYNVSKTTYRWHTSPRCLSYPFTVVSTWYIQTLQNSLPPLAKIIVRSISFVNIFTRVVQLYNCRNQPRTYVHLKSIVLACRPQLCPLGLSRQMMCMHTLPARKLNSVKFTHDFHWENHIHSSKCSIRH